MGRQPSIKNKWAIIGKGFIFPRHKEAIEKVGDKLIATCDIDPSKEADFMNWRDIKKSEIWDEITHISLCAPNYTHIEMARELKDKIILCEKPLALNSKETIGLSNNVFTVLQLRHHPEVVRIKQQYIPSKDVVKEIKLFVGVKRDDSYWNGWKGKDELSGGILLNLGIHYFDLLIYLFGNKYKILYSRYNKNFAEGTIRFFEKNILCKFYLEINNMTIDRYLDIDNEQISFSKKDNLSYENLHIDVYEALKNGQGVTPREATKSMRLVERLKYVI